MTQASTVWSQVHSIQFNKYLFNPITLLFFFIIDAEDTAENKVNTFIVSMGIIV